MLSTEERREIKEFAKQARINTIKQIVARGRGHIGGSMSIIDLLSVLYTKAMKIDPSRPGWEDRDWLICSKGHAGPAIYSCLAMKGFFPMEWLETLNRTGTNLPSHCDRNKTPGIDMTTGSLGQGISSAVGIAMAHKIDGKENRIFAIIGDGESQEGQVWEAALLAAQKKLGNLCLFIDSNKEQLDGYVKDINGVESFSEKFSAFGWDCREIDGHDYDQIWQAIEETKRPIDAKPVCIVCNTIKGKGCSFAIGKPNHHMNVSPEQAEEAIQVLNNE